MICILQWLDTIDRRVDYQIGIIIRNLNDFFIEKVSHHVIQEYGTKATTHACTVHYPQM